MMQYVLTPHSREIPPYAFWENVFNDDQLNWLQLQAINSNDKAMVGNGSGGSVNNNIRRSSISWLNNSPESLWVFQILGNAVSSLNSRFFGFDLSGFGEAIQLTNYDESEKGMYGWHVDMCDTSISPCRKLSIVVQLTDPNRYEGGLLELSNGGSGVIQIKRQRGLLVAFPSWSLHQVTPVIKGNRQSLVSWISGPPFR